MGAGPHMGVIIVRKQEYNYQPKKILLSYKHTCILCTRDTTVAKSLQRIIFSGGHKCPARGVMRKSQCALTIGGRSKVHTWKTWVVLSVAVGNVCCIDGAGRLKSRKKEDAAQHVQSNLTPDILFLVCSCSKNKKQYEWFDQMHHFNST